MLSSINQQLAVDYLNSVWSTIPSQFDDLLQIAAIQLIRKDCSSPQADKPKYIQLIFSLMSSPSHTVKYEAANTLVSLSSHSSAVRGAASCYIDLVLAESDNNVKLIVLKRLSDLRQNHKNLINDLAMDVLRVLSSPDITVRKTLLSIALDMVDTRNVDQVVGILTKELLKTRHQDDYEKNLEYRQLLVQTIHSCAIKFSLVAANVVHVLMEFIGDSGSTSAVDVVSFVRQVMEKFPLLRHGILTRLNENLAEMKTGRVFRGAFWIIGEYSDTQEMIVDAFQAILKVIGDIPIIDQVFII